MTNEQPKTSFSTQYAKSLGPTSIELEGAYWQLVVRLLPDTPKAEEAAYIEKDYRETADDMAKSGDRRKAESIYDSRAAALEMFLRSQAIMPRVVARIGYRGDKGILETYEAEILAGSRSPTKFIESQSQSSIESRSRTIKFGDVGKAAL